VATRARSGARGVAQATDEAMMAAAQRHGRTRSIAHGVTR
jgi:hypothetical protein